jgi:hypothetical protein
MVIVLCWSLIYPVDLFVGQLRAPIATKLGEALGSLLGSPEHTDRAVTVMVLATKPQKEGLDYLPPRW